MIQLTERPPAQSSPLSTAPAPVADHEPATEHEPAVAFTDAEWAELRRQDTKAAGIIVAIMVAIFMIGLVLYTAISLIVMSGQ